VGGRVGDLVLTIVGDKLVGITVVGDFVGTPVGILVGDCVG